MTSSNADSDQRDGQRAESGVKGAQAPQGEGGSASRDSTLHVEGEVERPGASVGESAERKRILRVIQGGMMPS